MIRTLGHIADVTPSMLTSHGCVHFTWTHRETYRDDAASKKLHILLFVDDQGACASISEAAPDTDCNLVNRHEFTAHVEQSDRSLIDLTAPLPLTPVHIPKPWGQEIWYSGIEARGVSLVKGTPVAWLLDIFGHLLGCPGAPLLLKILDPFPEDNLGDLYFEMHEKKIEVYVVTGIDTDAWPDGVGAIRYGFNRQKLRDFESREMFLAAYVEQVREYQTCRNSIDELLRKVKVSAGHKPDDPLDPVTYNRLLSQVPADLRHRETDLREKMYAFTSVKPLRTGDVVTVRPLVPHSLQHGVRVVEFQTPHYERYILSFGQQVLTQGHWDTQEVLARASTEPADFDPPVSVADNQALVADFEEFRVTRIQLVSGESIDRRYDHYTLLMGIEGTVQITGGKLEPESAYFVPAAMPMTFTNAGKSPAVFLIAEEV